MTAAEDERREGGEAPPGFTVRRIVVAVDSSAHATAALEAAVALAARMHADMEALFVEDIDLFNLAALPFGHEITLATGSPRTFDTAALEEQLRREVSRARRAVEEAARRAQVRSSFRVARGRIAAEVMAAAGTADLLIMGTAGQGVAFRFRPGRVALAAAENAPRSVLLLREGAVIRGRPLVAYDASPSAEKALDAAARLADATRASVRVLVAEPDQEKATALRERAAARLAAAGIRAEFSDAFELTLDTMCRTVQETDADVLVIAADNPRLEGEGRLRLLQRVTCPVLLIR
jgi:nucleotide-binding universal stress UspA family protein